MKIWKIAVVTTALTVLCLGGLSWWPLFLNNLRNPLLAAVLGLAILAGVSSEARSSLRQFFTDPTALLSETSEQRWIWITAIFYLLFFLKVVYFQYLSFRVQAIDFSLFDYMLVNTARGKFMQCVRGINHFGIHSTPILFFLYPLHRLFDSPLFLLFTHAVILWSGFLPLWKLSRRHLSAPLFRYLIVFSFFNFTYLFQVLEYNFHIEAFYVPLFFWLFYFLEDKRFIAFWITVVLLYSVKEDAAVYLASIGIAMAFNSTRRRQGLVLTALSIVVFFVNTRWVIPHFAGKVYQMAPSASAYGSTLPEILRNIARAPGSFLKTLVLGRWLTIAGRFLFTPLFSPFVLISILPFAAIHALARTYVMQNIMLYYSAPYIPFLFYGWILFQGRYRWPLFASPFEGWQKAVLLLVIALNINLVGGSYLVFRPKHPDLAALSQIQKQMDLSKSMCVQGVLIPHFPYPKNLKLLSSECIDQGLTYYVIDPELDPFDLEDYQFTDLKKRLDKDSRYHVSRLGNIFLYERSKSE